jgi:hypothetical protein
MQDPGLQAGTLVRKVLGKGLIEFVIERSKALEYLRMHTRIIR